jgi:ubiquinone/menaquinone biosynthesis C-methylase UbiE
VVRCVLDGKGALFSQNKYPDYSPSSRVAIAAFPGGIMESVDSPTSPQAFKGKEEYRLKNSEFQRNTMTLRSAARQAGFLLPHLGPGMNLLDCGCGPGSITTDLAQHVAPGLTVGIDNDPSEVERATQRAAELGISTVSYKTASVYELPFEDGTFDAVYCNAVLDHLSDPVAAITEMYRVLKPGGVAGIRTADRDGYLTWPIEPLMEKWAQEGEARKASQGVRVRIGKRLRSFMHQVGFVRAEASASYDSYGTPESLRRVVNALLNSAAESTHHDASPEFAAAVTRWGESPDAFFAMCFCEAVGWRE